MSGIQNLKGKTQPYGYSFADRMNYSYEGNDSRVSSFSSSKISNSNIVLKQDEILRNGVHKRTLGKKISIDFMSDNEFMTGFENDVKNISSVNNQSDMVNFIQRNKKSKFSIISNMSSGSNKHSDTQNSFLLDTQTYKNICQQENTKKSQLANLLSSSASMNTSYMSRCQIHDSPFQIVCIQDKSLICSHCAIFGEHRTHSLASLKKIDEFIKIKRQQVSEIIADYKSLQLGIKQKAFMSEFSQKLQMKKKQTSSQIMQSFKSIRQFLTLYETQLVDQVEKLYSCLEGNISEAVKRVSLDSNRAAFEKWREDALGVVEQLGYREMSKASQVSLFLSNFLIPTQISNCTPSKHYLQQTVSLQTQGKQYLSQIQQELILNINQVMKISSKFKLNFVTDFKQKLKAFFSFDADSQLEAMIQQNKLTTIMGMINKSTNVNNNQCLSQMKITHDGKNNGRMNSNNKSITSPSSHIRNSFSHFNKQPVGIVAKHKQPQLASTINTTTQSVPFINMVKNNKFSSPKNGLNISKIQQQKHHQELISASGKLPLKFKKRQQTYANQEIRRSETSVRSIDLPFNLTESKSFCLDADRRRKVSPSPKNMVKVRNDHFFVSPSTARLNRCSSRQPASIYTANLKEQQTLRESKLKTQRTQSEDPLKIIENYEQIQTQNFDLSNCQLNDTEIIYFVQKASKIRKIKHLKLAGNQLTDAGLEKILFYLPNCNLMNLSNNKLSENTIDLLLKKREKIQQLKLVNLSNNKLNERKIKQKISEFKRMGIVVTL